MHRCEPRMYNWSEVSKQDEMAPLKVALTTHAIICEVSKALDLNGGIGCILI